MQPQYDPWDPFPLRQQKGQYHLTSVEFTVTQRCNMRCAHCAVGDTLTHAHHPPLPLPQLFQRLDEVEALRTLSLTGGEPFLDRTVVQQTVRPLLDYAKRRGLFTQVNTNLTLDLARYEEVADVVDVFHISHNAIDAEAFLAMGFAKSSASSPQVAQRLYARIPENARSLAMQGAFVSAETMVNTHTHALLGQLHRDVVAMGCRRHEIHPMYAHSFATDLPILPLDDVRRAIHRLLDERDRQCWMLFGTLPFYACSDNEAHRALVARLHREPHVTVRNDPDGRNRLNINIFTGAVSMTDFADVPAIGNVLDTPLSTLFSRWQAHPLQQKVACYCPQATCCGPNLTVAHMYYPDVDFTTRKAFVSSPTPCQGRTVPCYETS